MWSLPCAGDLFLSIAVYCLDILSNAGDISVYLTLQSVSYIVMILLFACKKSAKTIDDIHVECNDDRILQCCVQFAAKCETLGDVLVLSVFLSTKITLLVTIQIVYLVLTGLFCIRFDLADPLTILPNF